MEKIIHQKDSLVTAIKNKVQKALTGLEGDGLTIEQRNGKIYISKHAIMPKSVFQKMYPDYKKINNLKIKYDPDFVFSSDATNRLLIEN